MKKTIYIYLILIFTSCETNLYNGNIITKEIGLNTVSEILINGNYNIILANDTMNKVEILWDENLMNDIHIINQNDSLIINDQSKNNWILSFEKPSIKLYLKDFKKIRFNDVCNLQTIDTLKMNDIYIMVMDDLFEMDITIKTNRFKFANCFTNTGIYTIKGNSKIADLNISAAGYLNASEFSVNDLYVTQKSVRDVSVNVTEKLTYSILYSGNLIYIGNPLEIIEIEHSGKGVLIDVH